MPQEASLLLYPGSQPGLLGENKCQAAASAFILIDGNTLLFLKKPLECKGSPLVLSQRNSETNPVGWYFQCCRDTCWGRSCLFGDLSTLHQVLVGSSSIGSSVMSPCAAELLENRYQAALFSMETFGRLFSGTIMVVG